MMLTDDVLLKLACDNCLLREIRIAGQDPAYASTCVEGADLTADYLDTVRAVLAMAVMPEQPTPEMLGIIAHDNGSADWQEGKDAQQLGYDVPASHALETAYGQYQRLRAVIVQGGA